MHPLFHLTSGQSHIHESAQTNYTKANETLIVFFSFLSPSHSNLLKNVFKCIGCPPKQLLYLNLKKEDAASCFRVNHIWCCFAFVLKPLKPIQKMSMGINKRSQKYMESERCKWNVALCWLLFVVDLLKFYKYRNGFFSSSGDRCLDGFWDVQVGGIWGRCNWIERCIGMK